MNALLNYYNWMMHSYASMRYSLLNTAYYGLAVFLGALLICGAVSLLALYLTGNSLTTSNKKI